MSKLMKILVVVLVVGILSVSAFAFAASNTVPDTMAGEGSGVISGYTVTNVVYNLNAADPTQLDSVAFTLSAAASKVKIQLDAGTTSWYTCALDTGFDWTCTTDEMVVADMDTLTVVASSN